MATLTDSAPPTFISADELLDLSPCLSELKLQQLGPSANPALASSSTTTQPPPSAIKRAPQSSRSRSRQRQKAARAHVSFCPVVRAFCCAPDGERDAVLVSSASSSRSGSLSLPRLGVKTYSLEGINISAASSRAWSKVAHSLAGSFSPNSFAYGGAGGGGRPLYHEEDTVDERLQKKQQQEVLAACEEKGRTGRLSIRLPGLRRATRSRSASNGATSRGILRRASDDASKLDQDECASDDDCDEVPQLVHSPASSPPLSSLSSSPTEMLLLNSPLGSPTTLGPSQTHIGAELPLNACCIRCERAFEYGLKPDETYKEKFTAGAKRLRAAEERRQTEEKEKKDQKSNMTPSQLAILEKRAKWEKKETVAQAEQTEAEVETGTDAAAPAPFAKGRKVAVDELVTARREQRQEAREADHEARVKWCANPDETIGFDVLERKVPGSPTTELPSSPLAALGSPTPAVSATAAPSAIASPTAQATVERPPPPARSHSSADDILPSKTPLSSPKPAPPKRKFSLSLFGAFGDASGGRTF